MGERTRIVTFRRGRTLYGVDVRRVRKVLRAPAPRPLPAAPAFVPGGIEVEGRLEVLVDVAVFFGDKEAVAAGERAVLVTVDGSDFALSADQAGDVTDAEDGQLQPVPPFVGGSRRHALLGLLAVGREQVLVVDLARLLSSAEQEGVSAVAPPADAPDVADR